MNLSTGLLPGPLALALVAIALLPGGASAHGVADPRVLVVVAGAAGLELRLNDMEQPGADSATLRRRFDQDRDGALAAWEKKDLADFLVARAIANVKLSQEGAAVSLATVSQEARGLDGTIDSSEPVSIDVVLRATPRAGRNGVVKVVVGDWRIDGHVVRVAVVAQGVTLASASTGSLDATRGVVSGVEIDREKTLTLEYVALEKPLLRKE